MRCQYEMQYVCPWMHFQFKTFHSFVLKTCSLTRAFTIFHLYSFYYLLGYTCKTHAPNAHQNHIWYHKNLKTFVGLCRPSQLIVHEDTIRILYSGLTEREKTPQMHINLGLAPKSPKSCLLNYLDRPKPHPCRTTRLQINDAGSYSCLSKHFFVSKPLYKINP